MERFGGGVCADLGGVSVMLNCCSVVVLVILRDAGSVVGCHIVGCQSRVFVVGWVRGVVGAQRVGERGVWLERRHC